MTTHIFNTAEVQDFLRMASGLTQPGGNARAKQIVHRLLSDLFKAIDDLDITSDQ
jgi:catechol 1,2-dioxygenase